MNRLKLIVLDCMGAFLIALMFALEGCSSTAPKPTPTPTVTPCQSAQLEVEVRPPGGSPYMRSILIDGVGVWSDSGRFTDECVWPGMVSGGTHTFSVNDAYGAIYSGSFVTTCPITHIGSRCQ
jgi:hypothetical protein